MRLRPARFGLLLAALTSVSACGGAPLLSHLPSPDASLVAGLAAATAAAVTLADPNAAAKKAEHITPEQQHALDHRETIPPDVFDRMDKAQQAQDAEGAPATAP